MRLAPSRWLLVVVVTAAGLSLWPGTSAAAACADYPNQAAAQQAGDTRDADGDGIYVSGVVPERHLDAQLDRGLRQLRSMSS